MSLYSFVFMNVLLKLTILRFCFSFLSSFIGLFFYFQMERASKILKIYFCGCIKLQCLTLHWAQNFAFRSENKLKVNFIVDRARLFVLHCSVQVVSKFISDRKHKHLYKESSSELHFCTFGGSKIWELFKLICMLQKQLKLIYMQIAERFNDTYLKKTF